MTLKSRLLIDYYVGGALHLLIKPIVVVLGLLLHRNHSLKHVRDVTIVKLIGGGSLVQAYPSLLAIKSRPGAGRLRLLTLSNAKPFAELLNLFDEIIVIRDEVTGSFFVDAIRTIIRLWRCEAVVDLEIHSRLSTILCLLTAARNRIGFYTHVSFWRRSISTHLLFCQLNEGIFHFYDQIAQLFGAQAPPWQTCSRAFRLSLGISEIAPEPSLHHRRVAIAPSCSELANERMLRPDEWKQVLAARFGADGPLEIHLTGGKSDFAHLESVKAELSPLWPLATIHNHAGVLNLRQSVMLVSEMDQLFAIDSSMLHFARLLGVPTVSYWGPTDPVNRLRPADELRDEIHYARLPCSPCVHIAAQTPCRGNNLCMRFSANPEFPGNKNPPWLAQDVREE